MRPDRVSYDFTNWAQSNTSSKLNPNLTPRNKNKQGLANDNSRRSVSPLRYTTNPQPQHDKITSSPLRVPLQQAISRCFPRDRSIDKSTSRRTLAKSSRRQEGSFIEVVKKISYEDELNLKNVKAHSETLKFLKKYFDMNYIIPTDEFVSKILQEYGSLWDNQNSEQWLQDFAYKINEIFGVDGVDPKHLIIKTKTDGMLGLIMTIFKELKEQESTRNSNYTSFSRNPQVMSINKSFEERLNYNQNVQNIKNVVQEFMESMYQCMQAEIYNKFNIEMRRMVLKYREAEKMIKKVNEKITTHADLFDLEEKLRKQKKFYDQKITQIEKNKHKLESQLNKEKEINNEHKNAKFKLEEENRKLKENMDKLQGALINKALESGNTSANSSQINFAPDPSVSRRSTMPLTDRTQQFINSNMNMSNTPIGEPFQIKIDTHIVQKDLGPPSTYTTTTFGGPMPTLSPLKQNKENHFMDGRYSYSPYGTKFQTSRLY